MKPALSSASWLTSPNAQTVMALLEDAGHKVFFVGGCVRNALIDAPVADVDISTDAPPNTVMNLANQAGHKAIPTGIDHGTVTVVVEGSAFEITTFRRDVATDGRHATIAFTASLTEDARRRDFTMNALYADARGVVFDPLGTGEDDLFARHIRFIENATDRIKEDYLRILRFFRFYAWYGTPNNGPDSDALAAIAANTSGIDSLSRERIGSEMRKLLAAPDPAPALASMEHSGALLRVLPGAATGALAVLIHLENEHESEIAPDPMCRLAAIGGADVGARLRLSKKEQKRLETLRFGLCNTTSAQELGYRHGMDLAQKIILLRAAMSGILPPANYRNGIDAGVNANFPLQSGDLMPAFSGRALGDKLRDLEARWIASGFRLSRHELLQLDD